MNMSDMRGLVYAINKFLKSEISEGRLPEDKVEGVEICIQTLEFAYDIGSLEPELDVPFALQDIFHKYLSDNEIQKEPTAEEKAEAERFKDEGNRLMDSMNFKDAVASYSKAVQLDPTNPKYFCNRAAALNNLRDYEGAVRDCERALSLDLNYSKAYCRLGHAHAMLNRNWPEAVRCFRRAVELEPGNERYLELLRDAECSLESSSNQPRLNGINLPAGNISVLDLHNDVADIVRNLPERLAWSILSGTSSSLT